MRDAAQKNLSITNTQANLLAWQKLENELLEIPAIKSTPVSS
jgi:hypothetical protein